MKAIIIIFLLNIILVAQIKNQTPLSGYWVFSNDTIMVSTEDLNMTWMNDTNGYIKGTVKWIDAFNIEESITSEFNWVRPPQKLVPGNDVNITIFYINIEYSTISNILSGISIFFSKAKLKIIKSKKEYSSESKSALISVPDFYEGDDKETHFIIDCFIGNSHYIISYIYLWVSSQNE